MSYYRYGFNGKEKDVDGEWGENTTAYDYGFRIYNPSIGKFLSVDPLMRGYPMLTPYQFASNTPIMAIDLDGLEKKIAIFMEIYTKEGIQEFAQHAKALEQDGFEIHIVATGKQLLDVLSQNKKLNKDAIEHLVIVSHGFSGGLKGENYNSGLVEMDFLVTDAEENLPKNYDLRDRSNVINGYVQNGAATIDDIGNLIKNGDVKFSENSITVLAGCNTGYSCEILEYRILNPNSDEGASHKHNFALELSKVLPGSVIFSSPVERWDKQVSGLTKPYPEKSNNTKYRQSSNGSWNKASNGDSESLGNGSVLDLSTGKVK